MNKLFKRFTSILLVVCLVAGLSVTAFAAPEDLSNEPLLDSAISDQISKYVSSVLPEGFMDDVQNYLTSIKESVLPAVDQLKDAGAGALDELRDKALPDLAAAWEDTSKAAKDVTDILREIDSIKDAADGKELEDAEARLAEYATNLVDKVDALEIAVNAADQTYQDYRDDVAAAYNTARKALKDAYQPDAFNAKMEQAYPGITKLGAYKTVMDKVDNWVSSMEDSLDESETTVAALIDALEEKTVGAAQDMLSNIKPYAQVIANAAKDHDPVAAEAAAAYLNKAMDFYNDAKELVDEYWGTDLNCPMNDFKDLDKKAWYHDGVHYCLENGIMSGNGNGTFSPAKAATRAEIMQMLFNMEGQPASNYAITYPDVKPEEWYVPAIRWATENKIVDGNDDGTFAPNKAVTREQLAKILYGYAVLKGYDVSQGEDTNILSYNDASKISQWATPYMQWAVGAGLIGGDDKGMLNPRNGAERDEVATIFMRFCKEFG